jgi:hypothetical protein
MPIMASATDTQTYSPAPEGVHQAVCVDIEDLGILESTFKDDKTGLPKKQRKIKVYWQIGARRDDGKRFVLSKRYTLSLHEKASLRHDLEAWRGRAFTEDELRGFDVETVKGANCLLNVQHRQSADKTRTYANVVSITPLVKGMEKMGDDGYERWVPKSATDAPQPSDETPEYAPVTEELTDEDIPFAWALPLLLPLAGAALTLPVL